MTRENPIHRAAAEGFARGADAYVKGRPDYPPEIAAWLRHRLDLGEGKTVVDLGAGTGKFTPYLLSTGATVNAVEPVPQMLARLTSTYPQAQPLSGSATSIPLANESVDAVVCAQAFHWFATPTALAEIHRVLKPGGRLGLVWNLKDTRVGWVAALDSILTRYRADTPNFGSGNWRNAFPAEGFSPLHEDQFTHEHAGPPDLVILERALSTSFIAALAPEAQAQVVHDIQHLIAHELNGASEVVVPYETKAYCVQKLG